MRTQTRVSSKRKLAEALQISPPTLYAYMRLADSPPARNGYWYVGDFRRFITKKRDVMEMSEKRQLEVELLRAKLEKERYCLAEAQDSTRKQILEQVVSEFDSVFRRHIGGLRRLTDTLPPRLTGLGPQEIHSTLKNELQRAFNDCIAWLEERTGAAVRVETDADKLVPFEEPRKAVGG
jgi:hypothetical protein